MVHLAFADQGHDLQLGFAQGGRLRSELYIDCGDADQNLALFHQLEKHRADIEHTYGEPLSWEELPGKQACRLAAYGKGDVGDLEEHENYVDWFFDSLSRLKAALGPLVPLVQP